MLFSKPSLLMLAAYAAVGFSASLQQVSSFGANPTTISMYIYVPDKVATKPAIIVAVSSQDFRVALLAIQLLTFA
jgi:poly(3-hydroxybutyrate) depolymerase